MAATAAAAAILVLFDRAVLAANVIAFAVEITLMTGCAEGCVLGRGVYKHAVDAIAVTAAAPGVVSVVTRVVPLRVVAKEGRRPARRYMALVALYRRG